MGIRALTPLLDPNGDEYISVGSVGVAGGVASLDANGKVTAAQASSHIVAVTGGKTLTLADAGTFQRCTNSSAITITVPADASAAFPVGTEIEIYRGGAGTVTIAGASGVTLECVSSTRAIADQYTSAALKKLDTNVWTLQGNVG